MLVAGLLGHDRIPQHALRRFGDRPAEEVGEHHARARDDRHLLVAEKDHVARVAQNGGDVGRDEELPIAQADDDRRAVPDGDNFFRVVGRDEHQRKEAAHEQQRPAHRVLQAVASGFALNEVGDDLGVGFRDELVALPLQLVLEVEIVLDDAVVHDDDLPGAVAVGVRVLFSRPAVRRPARVPDAVVARNRVQRDDVLKPRQLAGASPQLDGAVVHDRHPGRVVAAIVQSPQPIDQNRHHFLGPNVSNDPAHG